MISRSESLAQAIHTLTISSVESSSTCTTSRSAGHDSPHTAPMDSWYTCITHAPHAVTAAAAAD
jgi:hypothetical protein